MAEINRITGEIVDAAFRLHNRIGPGLLESVYEALLCRSLERKGFRVERQKPVSFEYDGMRFDEVCRLDLLVEGVVVVELKSVEKIAPVHHKQILTYLRLMDLPIGLLLNFGAPLMKDGVFRVANARASTARAILDTAADGQKLYDSRRAAE